MNTLQKNGSEEEPNIVCTRISRWTSQHGTKNVKTCNLTILTTRTLLRQVKNGGKLRCSGRVSNSWRTSQHGTEITKTCN